MMPTPELLRWVTTELAVEVLLHYAAGGGQGALDKQVDRWFPDAHPEELLALRRLAREHLDFYAILLRRRANAMVAAGRMTEGRFPR